MHAHRPAAILTHTLAGLLAALLVAGCVPFGELPGVPAGPPEDRVEQDEDGEDPVQRIDDLGELSGLDDPADDPDEDPADDPDEDPADDPDEDELDTCAAEGDHGACAWDEMCWEGSCEPVLGQPFRVIVESGSVAPLTPWGYNWDEYSVAPDLYATFAAAGQPWSYTDTAWDSYEATWSQYVDATFAPGGAFYVELYDNDYPSTTWTGGAWAWLGDVELVELARSAGEPVVVEVPVEPETGVVLTVLPL